MNKGVYIQFGCGWSAPEGWRNFDASPTLRFERLPILGRLYTKNESRFPNNVEYGDIVKGLPIPTGSCKAIYCSHVLEHLSLEDFRRAVRNTISVLEPAGVFRFVLPDLEWEINQYIRDPAADAAIKFMRSTGLGYEKRARGIKQFLIGWMGNSQHLWMWDYKSIKKELEDAGFVEVRRALFGDSSDPVFKDVEDEGRWVNCLGIECKKPD